MNINTVEQLKDLQSGSPFLGYPEYYVTKDCGTICPCCLKENLNLICEAMEDGWDNQWIIIACEINYEDDSLYCDNCCKQIKSAYGDDE